MALTGAGCCWGTGVPRQSEFCLGDKTFGRDGLGLLETKEECGNGNLLGGMLRDPWTCWEPGVEKANDCRLGKAL